MLLDYFCGSSIIYFQNKFLIIFFLNNCYSKKSHCCHSDLYDAIFHVSVQQKLIAKSAYESTELFCGMGLERGGGSIY